MNEIAKLQTNAIAKMADERGLYCQVREVNTGDLKLNKSGMYIMFGMDKGTVDSFAQKSPDGLYELARQQAVEHGVLFPKCQIIQLKDSNSLIEAANAIDKMITLEFIRDKANDFNIKSLPSQIEYPVALLASYYYREALNLEYPVTVRESAMRSCKMIFEYFGSSYKTAESFLKNHKEYLSGDSNDFEFATGKKYESNSEYNIPLEEVFRGGGRKVTSCAIQEKDLPELEKMLSGKKIKYHIDPDYVISDNFGTPKEKESVSYFKNSPKARVWHTVYYDEAYDSLINGWYSAKYYSVLKEHTKQLTYEPNSKYMPIIIPAAWIEGVCGYLNDIKANYYFDVNGAYAQSTSESIGLVVDNKTDFQRVANAVNEVLKSKTSYKEVDKTLEIASLGRGKEQQEALKMLEERNNKKELSNNISR